MNNYQKIQLIIFHQILSVTFGILTLPDYEQEDKYVIYASQIYFLEQSGIDLVPINGDSPTLKDELDHLDGIFLQGGFLELIDQSGVVSEQQLNVNKILDYTIPLQNDDIDFIIVGHCLGFENIILYTCMKLDINNCFTMKSIENIGLNLKFQSNLDKTLYNQFPIDLLNQQEKENNTANFHKNSLSLKDQDEFNLNNHLQLISTSIFTDENNEVFEFVSSIQHNFQKWQAVQYHPEKNNFVFIDDKKDFSNTDYSSLGSKLMSYSIQRISQLAVLNKGRDSYKPKQQIFDAGDYKQSETHGNYMLQLDKDIRNEFLEV